MSLPRVSDPQPISPGGLPSVTFRLLPEDIGGGDFKAEIPGTESHLEQCSLGLLDGPVEISCATADVAHGTYGPGIGDPDASLIVFELRFDSVASGHHIYEATVIFSFYRTSDHVRLRIQDISPVGNFSVLPISAVSEIDTNFLLSLGLNPAPMTTLASIGKRKVLTQNVKKYSKVIGRVKHTNSEAWWTLEANELDRKEGVPVFLRVAILLARDNREPFQCSVKLDALSLDFRSRLSASTPNASPLQFDPLQGSTNRLKEYDTKNLGKEPLSDLCEITPVNEWVVAPKPGAST